MVDWASARDRAADIRDQARLDGKLAKHPTTLGLDNLKVVLLPDETGEITDQYPPEDRA
jgi:hypothetical protein